MSSYSSDLVVNQMWEAYENNQHATCLKLVERIYEQQPDYPFWKYLHGELLRKLGRFSDAKREFLSIYPAIQKSRYAIEVSLGRTLDMLREDEEAERWFRIAIARNPHCEVAYVFLASLMIDRERFAEACEVLDLGLSAGIEPKEDADEMLLNLGKVRRTLEDFVGAEDALRQALALCPSYPEASNVLDDVRTAIQLQGQTNDE